MPTIVDAVVVVVSHIQRIGCQPEKTTLHGGGQSLSWSAAEQGKENIGKRLAAHPTPTPHAARSEKIKYRLAIAICSLKDRCRTIVSLTLVLVSCVVGVWLIVLTLSLTPYGKVPRLILKKTSRLTQAVVVSEGIFCAARCCVISIYRA